MENREIKFRCWDGVDMHYLEDEMFWLIGKSKYFELQDHRAEHYDTIESINGHKDLATINNCDNEQIILIQYTGLKDKNGVDIYEFDYILSNGIIGKVKFIGCSFMVEWDTDVYSDLLGWEDYKRGKLSNGSEYEIIGNIYQSPELLTTPKH